MIGFFRIVVGLALVALANSAVRMDVAHATQPALPAAAASLDDVGSKREPGTNPGLSGERGKQIVRRCVLNKPLFGGSPARINCYQAVAYQVSRARSSESAMLGDPAMEQDDDILLDDLGDEDTLEELDVPDGVRDAAHAVEVMRAWVADGALHVIFDPETFRDDVSEWGRLLGDVSQHISNAVELDGQMSRGEALKRIREAIEVSVSSQSVTLDGKIKGRTEH